MSSRPSAKELVDALIASALEHDRQCWNTSDLDAIAPDGLLDKGGRHGYEVVAAALDRYFELQPDYLRLYDAERQRASAHPGYRGLWWPMSALRCAVDVLVRRKLAWPDGGLVALSRLPGDYWVEPTTLFVKQANLHARAASLPADVLERLRELIANGDKVVTVLGSDKLMAQLRDGDDPVPLPIDRGPAWAGSLLDDLKNMGASQRPAWLAAVHHAAAAKAAKPSASWNKSARGLLQAVGHGAFRAKALDWLRLVPKGRTDVGDDHDDAETARFNVGDQEGDVLRGLVWLLALEPVPDVAPELADLLVTSLKKLPWQGPRAVKVANACIYGLGELCVQGDEPTRMSALAQLAKLKARVSFKTTLNAIQKALGKAAAAAGVSLEELEELGVPTFGFEGGRVVRTVGGANVELVVVGGKVETRWTNERGKTVKAAPAAVRRDHADAVKELKRIAKDAEAILGATRARLDGLYLRDASWSLDDWSQRYLDHGLVGAVAQRLIWSADGTAFLPTERGLEDSSGVPVDLAPGAMVRLWHPIDSSSDEVVAWRERVEALELTQPFKQAHREVYALTDAERASGTYSNRFAAHILKQHQFNALAKGRGWNNQLRLMVDDFYSPTSRELPAHGLRAEFWVEGVGDEYGTDTTESGSFLYLATDQVRFYSIEAAEQRAHAAGGGYETSAPGPGADGVNDPLPLDRIPAVVLSEILRDVDLFVGVASVANDPTWSDGGAEGRYRDYWHTTSFGELSATAESRRDLLERLVPRLKIADACTLAGRFLEVRGALRTYKIHLGSGNILMEPTDEYLCIVPGQSIARGNKSADQIFLPFEGDRTLSIILSKAFLLADDASITDRTIVTQITR